MYSGFAERWCNKVSQHVCVYAVPRNDLAAISLFLLVRSVCGSLCACVCVAECCEMHIH